MSVGTSVNYTSRNVVIYVDFLGRRFGSTECYSYNWHKGEGEAPDLCARFTAWRYYWFHTRLLHQATRNVCTAEVLSQWHYIMWHHCMQGPKYFVASLCNLKIPSMHDLGQNSVHLWFAVKLWHNMSMSEILTHIHWICVNNEHLWLINMSEIMTYHWLNLQGSVCAMCESILRAHGLKTGFYSSVTTRANDKLYNTFGYDYPVFLYYIFVCRSPHLLEVRERIRLNGKPLSKSMFVSYFWECYNLLDSTKVRKIKF